MQIENRDAFRVIQHYDKPDTLFFIDPPRIGPDQALGNSVNLERRRELAKALAYLQGKWILTYGDCEEAHELCKEHPIREVIMPQQAPVSNGLSKKVAWTQLIITNYEQLES